ncbi:hypothetical protein BHM03_00038491, partial [Ensete ventricosum]
MLVRTARYRVSDHTELSSIRRYGPVTGTRIARYRAVPPKSIVDGRLRGKKKKKKRRKKYLLSPHHPHPCTVAALARGRFFSHARRRNVSPRGAKDRGDIAPFFFFF